MRKSDEYQKAIRAADPIYAAMDDYREKRKRFDRLWDVMEQAENEAAEKHGRRPWSLIAWHRYTAIGWFEIDNARDEFLRLPGSDPTQIALEYRDAKKRLRECEKAQRAWDRKAGLTKRRQELDLASDAMECALMKLARTKPKTPAGAATLIAYLRCDISTGGHEWQDLAMGTLARALKAMDRNTEVAA